MGTLKNISPENLDVTVLRRSVAAGEEIEVDDALLTDDALVWPAATWLVNGAPHENDKPAEPAPAEPEAETPADPIPAQAAEVTE